MQLSASGDRQILVTQYQLGLAILQIVTRTYLTLRLIDGVGQFLAIEFRYNIKCTFGGHTFHLARQYNTQKRGLRPKRAMPLLNTLLWWPSEGDDLARVDAEPLRRLAFDLDCDN